jgi:hypothetical protein
MKTNFISDGEREILAQERRDAGSETAEGETCWRCAGSGLEAWDYDADEPIYCPCCGGTGQE